MATRPKFDFSHLTPAERLELAEALWNSLKAPGRPAHLSEPSKSYMAGGTTKDRVLGVVQQLPEDATVEQAIEQIYFLAKVEEGLRQADAGEVVTHEDAKRRLFPQAVELQA